MSELFMKPGRQYVVFSQKHPFELGDTIEYDNTKSIVVETDGRCVAGIEPATWYRRLYWWFKK